MLAENVGNKSETLKPLKIQHNHMETQGLIMRGGGRKCWKAFNTFKTIGNTNKYVKLWLVKAGMLAEMLKHIKNLYSH